MKTVIKIAITVVTLFFVGCAQPKPNFNPNNKMIVFVEGKPFGIPAGADYSRGLISDKSLKLFQGMGASYCQKGDITWEANGVVKDIEAAMKKNNKSEGKAIYRKAISEGKVGCTSPLSNQEYNYYRGKEMEQSANARANAANRAANARANAANRATTNAANANLIASTMPKTVNVQHSGYMNQNIQHSGYVNVYTP